MKSTKRAKKTAPPLSFFTSFHLPERAGYSSHKAPLTLHIWFQIFRALPVCLPDCFLLLRQDTVLAKANTSTELYHKNILFFTRWHETTILREWKAKKIHRVALFPILLQLFSFNPYAATFRSAYWKLVYYQSNHNSNRSIQNPCNTKRQRAFIISMRHGNAQKNNTHEERSFFSFY